MNNSNVVIEMVPDYTVEITGSNKAIVNKPIDFFSVDSTVLDGVIGQKEVIRKLKFFVDSHSAQTPIPTFLFTGSQGLGKSFMAKKIADALRRDFIEINCSTIETAEDFIQNVLIDKVMNGNNGKTILLDEAHALTSDITTLLLSMLNPNATNKNIISYNNMSFVYDMRKINIILATTDAYRIFRPLLDRCSQMYFDLYNNEDIFNILQNYLPGIELTCNKIDVACICRGRARETYCMATNIHRYCIGKKINTFNDQSLAELQDIFSIHKMGITTRELKLLRVIKDCSPISCHDMAIKLGVQPRNIEEELELRPRELGLILNTSKGRCLSERGLNYIKELS